MESSCLVTQLLPHLATELALHFEAEKTHYRIQYNEFTKSQINFAQQAYWHRIKNLRNYMYVHVFDLHLYHYGNKYPPQRSSFAVRQGIPDGKTTGSSAISFTLR